jgi:hypothetical protein
MPNPVEVNMATANETTEHAPAGGSGTVPQAQGVDVQIEPVETPRLPRDDDRIIAATDRMMRETRDQIGSGFDRVVAAIQNSAAQVDRPQPARDEASRRGAREDTSHSDETDRENNVSSGSSGSKMPDWLKAAAVIVLALVVISLIRSQPSSDDGARYGLAAFAFRGGSGSHIETVTVPDE